MSSKLNFIPVIQASNKGESMEKSAIKGFKVFKPDWTCSPVGNTFHYTCPGTFEMDEEPIPCKQGFHFCKKASDCFNHYAFYPGNKVAEVIALGAVKEDGGKCCTNKIQLVREIPWAELLTIVNEGKNCTGLCNTGDYNTGDYNAGDCNAGDRNTGDWNTGEHNTGDCNTGDWNTGDWNTGEHNTGDWNKTCFSSGVFCTEEPKILLFNKPSGLTYREWRDSRACDLLNGVDFRSSEWVWEYNMTDEEKVEHPEYKTVGGFLKVLDTSGCCKRWWGSLDDHARQIIRSIPNFDAAIFKKITGIQA